MIKISDAAGRTIKEISEGIKAPGNYNFVWDGKNGEGKPLPAGTYFYSINADGKTLINKTVITK